MPLIAECLKDPYTKLLAYDPVAVTFQDGQKGFWNNRSVELVYFENFCSTETTIAIATLVNDGDINLYKGDQVITHIDISDHHLSAVKAKCLNANLDYQELKFFSKERTAEAENDLNISSFQQRTSPYHLGISLAFEAAATLPPEEAEDITSSLLDLAFDNPYSDILD